jgi:hypothetical protein
VSEPGRAAFVGGIARFAPEESPNFLIDNAKFCLSLAYEKHVEFLRKRAAISPETVLARMSRVDLRNFDPFVLRRGPGGVPAISWGSPSGKFLLATRGGRAMVGDFNPLVAVRRALPVNEQRAHVKRVFNYLEPRVVSRAKGHEACLRYVNDWTHQACQDYCAITKNVLEFEVAPSDVLVSINMIELTWDQRTHQGLAGLASRLFWEPWKQAFGRSKAVFQVDRLEYEADGALKGIGGNGEIVKLYRKTEDLLRFEAQLTKHNAKKILGRRLDPKNEQEFAEGLKEIAEQVYGQLLKAQELAVSPSNSSLPELFTALLPTEPARYVTEQLVLTGMVKTRGQADYKVLRRMRDRGLVRIAPGKGYWCATPKHAETLCVLRRVSEAEAQWRAQ